MSIFGFLLTDSQLSRLYSKYGRQTFRLLASIRYMTHTHSLCTITATIMEFKTQFSMKYFRIPAGIDAIRIMFRDASISFFYCCSAVAIIPYFFFIFRLFLPWLLFFFFHLFHLQKHHHCRYFVPVSKYHMHWFILNFNIPYTYMSIWKSNAR